MPPTIAQQRGFAFAPIPFAVISFFSSSYVIYYLLIKERQKLERLYHRLILAMNFALLPLIFMFIWSTFAVPEGTPNYVGAVGSIATCTAQGFISLLLQGTVPSYYGSLSLQAFMGIKNKFQEEKYTWIEYPIHLFAWCVPAALVINVALTENFNPSGSGCYMAKAPPGCEADPDIPCERGDDIDTLEYIIGLFIPFLYFVFPPFVVISMYCWIKKIGNKVHRCRGMQQIRENVRKQMMRRIAIQISLYLFSFWFTFVPSLIGFAVKIMTGKSLYNLGIFGNCIFALQGFIMAVVYFSLPRLGTYTLEGVPTTTPGLRDDRLTCVGDIRKSAKEKKTPDLPSTDDMRESYTFNIFDGVPDEDSPWAQFFDEDDE